MRYQQFVDEVLQELSAESKSDVEELIEVVLSTLALRLSRAERADTAAELPDELKQYFAPEEEREILPVEEFANRIIARYDGGYVETLEQIQAVLVVLKRAISQGQFREILSDLPEEYGPLFAGG